MALGLCPLSTSARSSSCLRLALVLHFPVPLCLRRAVLFPPQSIPSPQTATFLIMGRPSEFSVEIQVQIDPMHAELSCQICGLRGQIRKTKGQPGSGRMATSKGIFDE